MNWVITYLLIGVGWDILYTFIAHVTESSNKLNNLERLISLVLWPIVVIIFVYHLIKGLLQ
jgi:hypothetical protein